MAAKRACWLSWSMYDDLAIVVLTNLLILLRGHIYKNWGADELEVIQSIAVMGDHLSNNLSVGDVYTFSYINGSYEGIDMQSYEYANTYKSLCMHAFTYIFMYIYMCVCVYYLCKIYKILSVFYFPSTYNRIYFHNHACF